jgi:hypothetical protein
MATDCNFFCYQSIGILNINDIGKFKTLSDYGISDQGINLSDIGSEKAIGCPPLLASLITTRNWNKV